MNRAEFIDLAVDRLHGQLAPDAEAAFQTYLKSNPDAHIDLANLATIKSGLEEQIAIETEAAWPDMLKRLRSSESPKEQVDFWSRSRMKLALFITLIVATIQAFLLLNAPAYRQTPVDQDKQQLIVIFAPNAQQKEVRDLLNKSGAQVSAGPGASGELTLIVDKTEADSALAALRASPIVEDAYTLKDRP